MKSTGRPDFQGWVLRRVLWIILVAGVSLSKSFHSGSIRPIVAGLLVAEVHPLLVLALAGEQRVEVRRRASSA